MAKKSQAQNDPVSRVFFILAGVMTVVLIVLGSLALWGSSFANNMVKKELSAQKIYFPEAGTPALDPAKYPDLQQYAGQLVDTPQEAKAYANGYIARHIAASSEGKTYAEVSTLARQNPTDEKLQELRMSVFMGETLRGILLGTGYAFGTIGNIAKVAAYVMYAAAGAMLLVALVLSRKALKR